MSDVAVELRERAKRLEDLKTHLKQRFCNIDHQIDMIVEFMRPWYLMPDLQRRPTVIPLWGLTGTGKTSLGRAIAEFLGMEPIYFDMGDFADKSRSSYVKNFGQSMTSFESFERQMPIVILDDIHKVRTIDSVGNEIDRPSISAVWDFISEGVVYTDSGNAEYVLQDLESVSDSPADASGYWHMIRAALSIMGVHQPSEKMEFRKRFREDPVKVIEEVTESLRSARIQSELNFSNSLIFITGNLDELFGMSEVFSADPDLTPDDLYEWSLSLTVPRAKEAVLKMFRPEQVARMGNNHVIYPAFSSQGLKDVIELGLAENAALIRELKGVDIEFEDSVKDIIYREGVFPTQGARPLIQTLDRLLQSSLPDPLLIAKEMNLTSLIMGFNADTGMATFRSGFTPLIEVPVNLVIDPLRKPTYDEEKATIAVHEAGHVVSTLLETGRPPLRVTVFTTHSSASGFSQRGGGRDVLLTAKEILSDVVIRLSGAEAEKMVFGEDNQTQGCKMDLRNATSTARQYVLEAGLSDESIAPREYAPEPGQMMVRQEQEAVVERVLSEARKRAKTNVSKHPELLARIAAELLENKFIGPTEIMRIATECGFEPPKVESRTDIYERFVGQYGLSAPRSAEQEKSEEAVA